MSLSGVLENIPKEVTLIAVSKKQPIQRLVDVYQAGHRDFGENYVQALLERQEYFASNDMKEVRWHFIGQLQRNKVKKLLPLIHSLHTLDSKKLAEEISKRHRELGLQTPLPVFVQVNIDEEESKAGFSPRDVRSFLGGIQDLPEISIQGLMCIPKAGAGRSAFQRLRELQESCSGLTAGCLSMGMSGDYIEAIEEGATHIRVGSAVFGPREN